MTLRHDVIFLFTAIRNCQRLSDKQLLRKSYCSETQKAEMVPARLNPEGDWVVLPCSWEQLIYFPLRLLEAALCQGSWFLPPSSNLVAED